VEAPQDLAQPAQGGRGAAGRAPGDEPGHQQPPAVRPDDVRPAGGGHHPLRGDSLAGHPPQHGRVAPDALQRAGGPEEARHPGAAVVPVDTVDRFLSLLVVGAQARHVRAIAGLEEGRQAGQPGGGRPGAGET
jgi:hypothetical protein